MGHVKVGKLPKVRGWKQVIALLDSGDSSSSQVAAATAKAAKYFLTQKSTDPSLVFSYWLLTQITARAKSDNFIEEIKQIGLDMSRAVSALDFLGSVASFTRSQIKVRGGDFSTFGIRSIIVARGAYRDDRATMPVTVRNNTEGCHISLQEIFKT